MGGLAGITTGAPGLACPACGHRHTQVKDSRSSDTGIYIRRRRHCESCEARFSTREVTIGEAEDAGMSGHAALNVPRYGVWNLVSPEGVVLVLSKERLGEIVTTGFEAAFAPAGRELA